MQVSYLHYKLHENDYNEAHWSHWIHSLAFGSSCLGTMVTCSTHTKEERECMCSAHFLICFYWFKQGNLSKDTVSLL